MSEQIAKLEAEGWTRVVFGADCDPDSGECPNCMVDYADCSCIGPTEDDVEYREVDGVMYGRRTKPQ